jgi:proline iminopeptidase
MVPVGWLASETVAKQTSSNAPRENRVPAGSASLYTRTIGQGPTVIVLHGGPDFDHSYLLPDLDRLADAYRLVYYDQRGRGRSADGVRPEDVTLASDLDDIDRVRIASGSDAPILLGHSWGAVLAVEYALRDPERVSHLVLMNPAPVTADDLAAARKLYLERLAGAMDQQRAITSGAAYKSGDPAAVAERYRIHFKPSIVRDADYERLMTTMKAGFARQGKSGILTARAVEDQLMRDTWNTPGYDRLPALRTLRVRTLVIGGEYDFMASSARSIGRAIPGAELVMIPSCGHFAFLECPDDTRRALTSFLQKGR